MIAEPGEPVQPDRRACSLIPTSPAIPTPSSSRPVRGAKVEYVSLQNLARETWHFASHRARVGRDAELDWVAGGFGSKKGKVRIENDLAGQGRDLAGDGRLLRGRRPAPRLRHAPGYRSEYDVRLRLQGRAARRGDCGLARHDPRRARRAEGQRLPGEPKPAPVAESAAPTPSPVSRSRRTTSATPMARR